MTWSYGLQFSLLETASADMNGKFQNKNIEFQDIENLNLRGFLCLKSTINDATSVG